MYVLASTESDPNLGTFPSKNDQGGCSHVKVDPPPYNSGILGIKEDPTGIIEE